VRGESGRDKPMRSHPKRGPQHRESNADKVSGRHPRKKLIHRSATLRLGENGERLRLILGKSDGTPQQKQNEG